MTLFGAVTVGSSALNVAFPMNGGGAATGDLFVDTDMEVGPVGVTGRGGLHVGGAGGNGSVNGTNGSPVTIGSQSTLIANPNAKVGALTVNSGATLLLGTNPNNNGPATLAVNGTATIGAGSTTRTFINNNGSTAGTDFSKMSATRNLTLNGTLNVGQGLTGVPCVALNQGDVATLFTTSGTLAGTFSNAPDGTVLTLNTSCMGPAAQVRINYTSSSVIATVTSGTTPTTPTTTTLATPNPSPAIANQRVTLTATVKTNSSGTVAPAGTVAFSADGTAIPGCASQPVTAGGSSGTATCTTSFAAASVLKLTAAFTGSPGSGQQGSGSAPRSLTVNKGSAVTATTSPATRVGTTQATLNGSVTTGGASVTWKFEYGQSTAYNQATPLQTIAAGQHGTVSVSSVLKRLSPNVRYHYRLVVYLQGSASPAAQSKDLTFTTRATGRLLGPGGRLSVFGRTILVPEKCQSSVLCAGRFSFTTTVRVGNGKLTTVVCATRSFRIKGHHTASARARLSAACMTLLRAQPHHRLAVTYEAQSRTGQRGLRKRITLVRR